MEKGGGSRSPAHAKKWDKGKTGERNGKKHQYRARLALDSRQNIARKSHDASDQTEDWQKWEDVGPVKEKRGPI